jgi:hypothetical protein
MAYCKTLTFNWSAFELHLARHFVVLNSLLLKQTDYVYDLPTVYEQECYTQFQRTPDELQSFHFCEFYFGIARSRNLIGYEIY